LPLEGSSGGFTLRKITFWCEPPDLLLRLRARAFADREHRDDAADAETGRPASSRAAQLVQEKAADSEPDRAREVQLQVELPAPGHAIG